MYFVLSGGEDAFSCTTRIDLIPVLSVLTPYGSGQCSGSLRQVKQSYRWILRDVILFIHCLLKPRIRWFLSMVHFDMANKRWPNISPDFYNRVTSFPKSKISGPLMVVLVRGESLLVKVYEDSGNLILENERN